jgi:hypothetical protein
MTPEQKLLYEDARIHQIALEHAFRAEQEARGVLSLQAEASEAWDDFRHYRAGTFVRWALKGLGL